MEIREGKMILQNLTLKNYRAFEELKIDFHEQMTVLVGINGAGKTTILDAAAVALSAYIAGFDGLGLYKITPDDARVKCIRYQNQVESQPQYPVEIDATANVFHLRSKERDLDSTLNTTLEELYSNEPVTWKRLRNSSSIYARQNTKVMAPMQEVGAFYQNMIRVGDNVNVQIITAPILAYYSTRRLWENADTRDLIKTTISRQDAYKNCLDAHLNLSELKTWFERMTYKGLQSGKMSMTFSAVKKAMEIVFERIADATQVCVDMDLDIHEIVVNYQDKNDISHRLTLNQLSDGYKSTICLIADIAYRMAVLNPQLENKVLEKTGGIVLIDEVDLHLHPAWQQRVLSDLMEIFPKVQFIVTTHAPSILSCVKTENLRILSDNQIIIPSAQVYGDDVNSLMKRIMGVPERNPETAEKFKDFYNSLKNGQFNEAESFLDQIEIDRDYHDTELAGCRTKLKLERIRRGLK